MAYFRCGGGGIPSSLKTDMNAVLNKKFGTSTDYPPADWAPTVNLMGPLPEKTQASASVCSFDDGADDVPTKSLVVTIPPTLSGVSAVTETQTGRNLFDKTTATIGKYINVNGQEATNEIKAHSVLLPLKPSTSYYMSGYAYGSYYSILAFDKDMNVLSTWYGGASKTEPFVATTPNNARWCYLNFNADQIDNVIFAESATAIPYEACNGTTYTASLGRTIYGGTADIVNGEGSETEKGKWLSELSWTQNATFPHVFNGTGFTDRKKGINWNNATCLSNRYTGYTSSEVGTKSEGIALATGATNTTIYVSDDRFETVAEFTVSLETDDSFVVLPLETATDFTFTGQEIPTRLGYNAFWSDSGDTEVTYRADIDLLLGGN